MVSLESFGLHELQWREKNHLIFCEIFPVPRKKTASMCIIRAVLVW